MRGGYQTYIPHTGEEASPEERAEANRRRRILDQIEAAVRAGDADSVKRLSEEL